MTKRELLEELGIRIGSKRSQIKTVCPKCSHTRKHQKDTCLSVNIDEGTYHCHNCGWFGGVSEFEREIKVYEKPPSRLEKLSTDFIAGFESRKISNNTLLRLGVTQAMEWMPQASAEMPVICFNYYRGGELVNIKFRGAKKAFKMVKDAELIFYNLDSLENEETAVIVEGEFDCLAMHESGIYNSISVPNGASKGNNNLQYIGNSYNQIKHIKKFILAVDCDEAGDGLKESLSTMLGKDRCYTVTYPEGCKDANEVLVKYGKEELKKLVEGAVPYPLDGILHVSDVYDELLDFYKNGYPTGSHTKIPGLDDLVRFSNNQTTTITGIPGHGKDEVMNLIAVSLSKMEEWVWGFWGFEESTTITVSKLMEKYIGKSYDFRKNKDKRMNQHEFERASAFVDKYFKFINTREVLPTVDAIIEKAKQLKMRHGIRGLVINPWSCLDVNQGNLSMTDAIKNELTKITNFSAIYDVHCFIVAHPTKMKKTEKGYYEKPTLYDISGSAHFYNLTHNGIVVFRDMEKNVTDVIVQKVKHSWNGCKGEVTFTYDTETRQYCFVGVISSEIDYKTKSSGYVPINSEITF